MAGAKEKASFLELVRYADGRDKFLMALGVLGSFGDGMMQPLSMLVLGDIVNSYGGAGTTGSAFSSSAVDKFALRLLYVAVGVGACAFLEGLCWTRTAERQASRMRRLYLEAVLRQQVEFFDAAAPSSQATTFRVISTISADADTIQDFLAEKVSSLAFRCDNTSYAVYQRRYRAHERALQLPDTAGSGRARRVQPRDRRREDGGARRAERLRQVDGDLPDRAVLRRAERLGPGRWQGHQELRPGAPPVADRARQPGTDALLRHGARQHSVRRRARHRGRGDRRRHARQRPRLHQRDGGRLRGARGGARGAAVGRAAAADRAGTGDTEEGEGGAAGRGDERAGRRVGEAGAGRRGQDDAGEDVRVRGAPPLHGAEVRHDRGGEGREGGGERAARRARRCGTWRDVLQPDQAATRRITVP